jgi:integrase
MARTGARRGGVCGAKLEDFDVRGRQLVIELKGGDRHELDLDGETLEALRAWTGWMSARGVRSGRLFRSIRASITKHVEIGDTLSPQRLYEIVGERAERAGIGHVFPHRLRHTFVSIALDNGIEPWRVRLVTGHRRELQVEEYATDLRAGTEPVSARLPSFASR